MEQNGNIEILNASFEKLQMELVEEPEIRNEISVAYYINDWWPGTNTQYTCQVQNITIKNKNITKFNGTHKRGYNDKDVVGIRFDDCKMTFVPSGICSAFENLKILLIYNSDIKKLKKDDFLGCGKLREIWFNGLSVEYLPGNLFEHMPDLEIVSLQSCDIKYIDPEILDCLPKLKVAKFNSNMTIAEFYDTVSKQKEIGLKSLAELKKKFNGIQPPPDYDTYYRITKNVSVDIKNFMHSEKYKDFTISIGDEEFKVHKFVLAARSSVLADMIYGNQNATVLNLADMKKEVFKEVLTYIYDDKLPSTKTNAFELFSAACRFDLEALKIHAIKNMTTNIIADNALDLLIYGKRYGNEELKDNAFDEIKKMFPDRELKDELANDTDKLKKIIEAKKEMEAKIKAAQEEFEKMFL